MNRTYALLIIVSLAVVPSAVLADGNGHSRSTADVVSEIAASQNVSSQDEIDCDTVTDEQFEELGDAVMQAMIGNDKRHEMMDNMMGGEESEFLRAMHIGMGQRHLGCGRGQFGTMGMGMMGGMMSMMGIGGIGMLLFWVVVIVAVVLFVKRLSASRRGGRDKGHSALGILKERYAKGEIGKEEFEEKKAGLS